MKTMKMLEPGAVAQVLGQALGMGRQWVDFLNDCRQDRGPGIHGERLRPFGYGPGNTDKHRPPLYRPADVRVFIDAVRAKAGARVPYPLQASDYNVPDPHGSADAWRLRRIERATPSA